MCRCPGVARRNPSTIPAVVRACRSDRGSVALARGRSLPANSASTLWIAAASAVRKQLGDQRHVHGAAVAGLGGPAVRRDEVVLRRITKGMWSGVRLSLDQPIQVKFGRRLSSADRPWLRKNSSIAARTVVFPHVRAQPRPAHLPIRPRGRPLPVVAHRRGLAPDIDVVVRHPALAARSSLPRSWRRSSLRPAIKSNSGSWHSARLQVSAGQ